MFYCTIFFQNMVTVTLRGSWLSSVVKNGPFLCDNHLSNNSSIMEVWISDGHSGDKTESHFTVL